MAAAPAPADELAQAGPTDIAKYFGGKTIRLMIGVRAGGGTDLQARHFAAHWGEFIPGKPRMTVTNLRPEIAAANRLYASDPDGFTLLMLSGPNVSNQFTPQANFKVEEFRIIGAHTGTSSVLLVSKSYPYKTIREAIGGSTVLRVGAASPDGADAMRIALLSELFNFPVKFVSGVFGTTENLIALERGDVDGYLAAGAGTVWYHLPRLRPGWMKDGTVRAFAIMGPREIEIGENSEVGKPDVPYAVDLIQDPRRKKQFETLAKAEALFGKVTMLPPKTPDGIVNALRASFKAVLADKAFRTKLEELMGESATYTKGDEIETALKPLIEDYAESQKGFEELIELTRKRF